VCKDCKFVGPDTNYTNEMLHGLYADYRSDAYNRERISFEPLYNDIKDMVGKSEAEINNRLENVSKLLKRYVDVSSINTVLDWGGGEGKFIPKELVHKKVYVVDVSNEPLVDQSYIRIDQDTIIENADYLQICHVLEHVGSPRDFLIHALQHLNKNGYLYIEVPQDRPNEDIHDLVMAKTNALHWIHEHINVFTIDSIRCLADSVGLKTITVESHPIDVGWMEINVISGLFRKV